MSNRPPRAKHKGRQLRSTASIGDPRGVTQPLSEPQIPSHDEQAIVDWVVADVRRLLLDDRTLQDVPPGTSEMARVIAGHCAVVAFSPRAPERSVKLVAELIASVHAAESSRGSPLFLPDSHSATRLALLNVLEQAFANPALFSGDGHHATRRILNFVRRSIPDEKLPAGFREPKELSLRRAAGLLSKIKVVTNRHPGGRDGSAVSPRGAAKRFADCFGVKAKR